MIGFLRFWLRLFFNAVALVLALQFVIGLFAPGTSDTAEVFQALQTLQPVLKSMNNLLLLPVNNLVAWAAVLWPGAWQSWFPVAPADGVMAYWAHQVLRLPNMSETALGQSLLSARYSYIFPGIVDWRLPLSAPLWGIVESMILGVLNRLQAMGYRFQLRRRDARLLKESRTMPQQVA